MWSDPDLKPYMAVTAHWLENVQSPGDKNRLTLRPSLIGFFHLPGAHTEERLMPFPLLSKGVGLK